MFRVGRRFSVGGDHCPAVIKDLGFPGPDIQHRLDREAIARAGLLFRSRAAIVRYLRRLVHPAADPMARIIANDAIAVLFGVFLNYGPDIADPLIRPTLLDSECQALFGHTDQSQKLLVHLANRDSDRSVPDEAIQRTRQIEGDYVTLLQ